MQNEPKSNRLLVDDYKKASSGYSRAAGFRNTWIVKACTKFVQVQARPDPRKMRIVGSMMDFTIWSY